MDMTNFFERQEGARRRTAQLVAIYGLTVILLIGGLYMSVVFLLEGTVVMRPWIFAVASTTILVGIWGARTIRLSELRQGGHVVAESLNGRKLAPSQATTAGQQLLNVVEEMAIAAGTQAPQVYVLPEKGINAFSAGFTQDDAVIGVTQGALQHLERDEMQGVVAHEISHILNGDTALNLRLMSWTHGIEVLRDFGVKVVRPPASIPIGLFRSVESFVQWGSDQIRSLASKGIAGMIALMAFLVAGFFFGQTIVTVLFLLLGATVATIYTMFKQPLIWYTTLLGAAGAGLGGVGALGAQLIRGRVSREREFLADAAAVQFTRNPEALGRALLKQRNCEHEGWVRTGGIAAVQHLFFGRAVSLDSRLAEWVLTPRWLSTHPPVEERVRHIAPSLLEGSSPSVQKTGPENEETDEGPSGSGGAVTPETLLERAGTLGSDQLAEAEALHAALPSALLDASHEPLGAVALVYALLMDEEAPKRDRQLTMLWEGPTPSSVYRETKRLIDHTETLDRTLSLPLVEVSAPSLRDLSSEQREQCRTTLRSLAEADDRLTMFEFALETIVRHSLDRTGGAGQAPEHSALREVREEVVALLSGLARAGHDEEEAAQRAFEAGDRPLAHSHDLEPVTLTQVGPAALHEALDRLARASLGLRKEILQACARCASADERLERPEEELMRAVAAALGVPLPLSVVGETGSHAATSVD